MERFLGNWVSHDKRQGAGALVTISLVWMVSRKMLLGRDARRRFQFER